jgi:hypothetical protein
MIGTSALLLSGCTTPTQRTEKKENLLAAAGFVQRPADTPARQAEIARLPPGQVVRTVRGSEVVYLYSDPNVCQCLYVGSQQAWASYQRERLQLRLANEEKEAAEMNENASMSWDWGPWGPNWW